MKCIVRVIRDRETGEIVSPRQYVQDERRDDEGKVLHAGTPTFSRGGKELAKIRIRGRGRLAAERHRL